MDTIIGGRFRIIRLIGEGGMGAVYEAQHTVLPRRVAVKILRPELSGDQSFVERFRREAIAAARVEHPNVVYIADFGATETKSVYLVMEYLEGTMLDQLLARQTRVSLTRTLPILAQIAEALDCAHRVQVVHRDLKPENILLTEVRGKKDFVKLLDFGIAKMRSPEFAALSLTVKGQVFGTAEYMSPEQATGEPVDGRSDIYAVGCLAYEMLTGDPPFTGSAVTVLQAHVNTVPPPPSTRLRDHRLPPALDAMVLRCLAKDPADRYQSGSELRRDLIRIRGLLSALPDELAAPTEAAPPTVQPAAKMTEGWHELGSAVPALRLSPGHDERPQPGGPLWEEAFPATATSVQPLARDPEQLRAEYQDALRELTIALVRAVLAPAETSDILERLLVIEEELAALTGTIALGEQKFDRIRFEYSQREKRLRYAMLDLSMEQAQLRGRMAVDAASAPSLESQLQDLAFQITELGRSCAQLEEDRGKQIAELDAEVKQQRSLRDDLEQEAAELFQTLHAQVETLRPAATAADLRALYANLDGLRTSLDQARRV